MVNKRSNRLIMIAFAEHDLLFDDFTLLTKTISRNDLIVASVNANCDCVGYTSPATDHDTNTAQIPPTADQAN